MAPGGAAEQGRITQGLEVVEQQNLAALVMTQLLAAEGVEVAMEQLEPVNLPIGAAGGAKRLALGVGRGTDEPDAEPLRRGGGRRKRQECESEMAEIAVQGVVEDLEGARKFPGADVMAGFTEGAGEFVGAGGEDVQVEIGEGVGAQVPQVIAGIAQQRLADNEASPGRERTGGSAQQSAASVGREFVEDIVQEDDVEFFLAGGEVLQRGAVGAQGGFGPAGGAERGKTIVQAAERGAGTVAGVHGDGAAAEVVEEGPGGGAGAGAEIEHTERLRSFGKGREFSQDMGKARVGLRCEVEGIGDTVASVAEVVTGGLGGRAGGGEAVGEAADVGQEPLQGVAVGDGPGFGLRGLQPVRFEFGRIGRLGHVNRDG